MKKQKTLIGSQFPFYLDNSCLGDSYYHYQIVSPSMLADLTPLFTLKKVSEKTGKYHYSASIKSWNHADIISTLLKSKKDIKTNSVNFIEKLLSKKEGTFFEKKLSGINVYENNNDFPLIELDNSALVTRTLIVDLRDMLRWRNYKFSPGNYIDILISLDKFLVTKVEGEGEAIWLKPEAVYSTEDVDMRTPIEVDLNTLHYPKGKFEGKVRVSELNRAIKAAEWKSFDLN